MPASSHSHASSRAREFPLADADYQFLARLIGERTGVVLGDKKRDMLYGRLTPRLRRLRLSSFSEYCRMLQSPDGEDELRHLVSAVTTHHTFFFREAHHIEHLAAQAALWPQDEPLSVWSAACSSGQEPYSIAMALFNLSALASEKVKLLATDIDAAVLAQAESALYPESELAAVPEEYRRYVSATPLGMRVAMPVRRLVRVRQLNLLDEPWPMKKPFDAIFCRNAMIYFSRETQAALFRRFAAQLNPGGWLYIGHSETVHGCDRFEAHGRSIYRRTA